METPYITRSIQAPPDQGGKKPEVFKSNGEQSKRSILDGIARDIESENPKDNLRALSASKNTGVLETSDGKSKGLENISAPVPGTDKEISLGSMIENGAVTPSKSMKEMADRHGIDMPSKNPQGPDPTRWENSPEMLKLPKPQGDLQNPELRELTGKLTQEINQPTLEKAEAVQSLDKAMASILSPQEKMATGLQPHNSASEEPNLPWLRKEEKSKEDEPVNPVTLFEDAGKKLQALPDKKREELLINYFQDKMGKAQKFTEKVKQKEEKEQSLLSDITTVLVGSQEKIGKMLNSFLNPHNIVEDGKDTFQAIKEGNLLKAAEASNLSQKLQAIIGLDDKEKKKINDRCEESGIDIESFTKNPLENTKKLAGIVVAVLTEDRKGAAVRITQFLTGETKEEKSPQVGAVESKLDERKQEEAKYPSNSTSFKNKKTDVATTRTTPGMQAFKAGIEFFQEATANKPMGDKLMGMGKTATKAVFSIAKGAGTKMVAGAVMGPAAPIAIASMVLATTLKFALEPVLKELKQESQPERSQEKDSKSKKDEKESSALDRAIDWFMPNTGGKKGLALKGTLAGAKKGAEAVKNDATNEKDEQKGEQQKKNSPDLNMV